ncbi:metallophosphoesterase [Myxococcota bacterium]|nr:metallophosphoesterase [Myxococcota bacterium]
MRITHLDAQPTTRMIYLKAASGGGRQIDHLEIRLGRAEGLPDDVDAVLCTSDLQGRALTPPEGERLLLMGEALADLIEALGEAGLWPRAARIGVILAGDLYSAALADERGATGDVRAVWRAFARRCAWVVGVAGNHDTFGGEDQRLKLRDDPRISLLDGDVVRRGGVLMGGVGYISATSRLHKGGRRAPETQLALIEAALAARPDVLILHEGPEGEGTRRPVARALTTLTRAAPLVICGHNPTTHALWAEGGRQILNVHERAILLLR